jgi:hypothetical protein
MTRLGIKRFIMALVVVCIVLLVCSVFLGPPSVSKLEKGCAVALEKSPSAETLEAWLVKSRIRYQKREAPYDEMFKEVLEYNGITRAELEQSKSCIYFENVPVRGGFLARHLAYGYFVFSADGSSISHTMHDGYKFL